MAEQEVVMRYIKSPHWRLAYVTGAALGSIGGPAGQQVILRFTNECDPPPMKWSSLKYGF